MIDPNSRRRKLEALKLRGEQKAAAKAKAKAKAKNRVAKSRHLKAKAEPTAPVPVQAGMFVWKQGRVRLAT